MFRVAILLEEDASYASVFARPEHELENARASEVGQTAAQERAAAFRQRYSANGVSTSAV